MFLTWTCESQHYQYPWGKTVNEALLLNPRGGALAAFGPAGITPLGLQARLYDRLYAHLDTPGVTLGEAVRRAKAELLAADPEMRGVVEGFNLLGDPSVKLGRLAGR